MLKDMKNQYPGSSLDMDEDGDPKEEGFAQRLRRDLLISDDVTTCPPSEVRRWREQQARLASTKADTKKPER